MADNPHALPWAQDPEDEYLLRDANGVKRCSIFRLADAALVLRAVNGYGMTEVRPGSCTAPLGPVVPDVTQLRVCGMCAGTGSVYPGTCPACEGRGMVRT